MSTRPRFLRDVPRRRAIRLLAGAGLVAFVAGLAAGAWIFSRDEAGPGVDGSKTVIEAVRPPRLQQAPGLANSVVVLPESAPYEAGEGAKVALVIDDLGRSLEEVRLFGELEIPLSWAVLPFEARTGEVVEELGGMGVEVLCHLPMEPFGDGDPGPGALTREMDAERLAKATREALGRTPGALGVNNHMGSALSEEPAAMRTILTVLAEMDLYYLDSRTNPRTIGYGTALGLGVPAAERQVFLDPDPAIERIRGQFGVALEIARREGKAIAIGHPVPTTLAVLRDEIPLALEAGYEFVRVSEVLDRPGVERE